MDDDFEVDTEYITEDFIYQWLRNDNGTLATYIKDSEQIDEDLVSGREALSETVGIWMIYAVEKNDQELFEVIFKQLDEYYLEEGFVYWKIEENGKSSVSTNALIDDIRIAESLIQASEHWNEEKYLDAADSIVDYLSEHNINERILTDFYDRTHDEASSVITMSYIDLEALNTLSEQNKIDDAVKAATVDILTEAPIENGFYPKSYNVENRAYHFDDDINMIDQLIPAYHLSREGIDSDELLNFIREEMDERGVIHGVYDRETKEPLVEYESPAVYGILTMYLLEIGETEFAGDVFNRMKAFQVDDKDNEYYGGYSITDDDTHIFDNIVPLLAEQRKDHH